MQRYLPLVILLLVSLSAANAATRLGVQGGSSSGDCTVTACTPQRSIDQALSGDTISWSDAGGNITTAGLTFTGRSNLTLTGNGTAHVTAAGTCLTVNGSTNITIKAMNIGPCTGATAYGVNVIGASQGTKIYDSYIHVETLASSQKNHFNVYIHDGSDTTEVKGCVLAFGESNVMANGDNGVVNGVTVTGNYGLNPRGPTINGGGAHGQHFQSWGVTTAGVTNVTVSDNYFASLPGQTFNPAMEDFINFGFTSAITANNNYVRGDGAAAFLSGTGCGIIGDNDTNNAVFSNNKFFNTGHVMVCYIDGDTMDINGNKGWTDNQAQGFTSDPNDTGMSVFDGPETGPCNNVQVRNNIIFLRKGNGSLNSYWNGSPSNICTNLTETNNTLDAAANTALNPFLTTNPPPLIPPVPQTCVAVSPYSTQTSLASCADGGPPTVPAAPTNLRVVSP